MAGALEAAPASRLVGRTGAPPQGFTGWVDLDALALPVAVWKRDGRRYIFSQSAIDLSAADDCDVAADGGHVVVVRGSPRVDEGALPLGRQACSAADVVLGLYLRDGVAAIERLRGRFAVCVIDCERRRVVLAVDRFSVYPLCWARDGRRLAFAARVDQVPLQQAASISPQALYDYLYFHMIPAPRTIFSGVQRLRVAERLVATPAAVDVGPYWRPVFARRAAVPVRELEERFRAALLKAVERECHQGNTAAFLSGGTDSSTISGLLSKVKGKAARAYSIGFEVEGYDEMRYARLAARHFGIEHREHYLTPAQLITAVPAVGAFLEQPFGNSSIVPAYWCAKLAAADGVDKLLAGDGGDELFGGNTRYAKQKVFDAYWQLPVGLRMAVERIVARGAFEKFPLLRKLRSYVVQARVPLPARAESYNLLTRLGAQRILSPLFLQAVDASEPAEQQASTWALSGEHVALVDRMLAYDWQYTLADSDLPKVCGSSALAGVAVGFPMLDDDLLDLSLDLPASMKVRGLTLRPFFKRALKDFLPREVIRKRKQGFGMPFGVWLAHDAALGSFVDERLASLSERGIFMPEALQQLRQTRLSEHAGYYGEMIWIALMLEEWLRCRAPLYRL
jgi:asparagine synthase (glutamine-hydrolysing)